MIPNSRCKRCSDRPLRSAPAADKRPGMRYRCVEYSFWPALSTCFFYLALVMPFGQECLAEPAAKPMLVSAPVGNPGMTAQSATPLRLPEDAQLQRDSSNQSVIFLKAADLSSYLNQDPTFTALRAQRRYADLAVYFLSTYRAEFRLRDPKAEMLVADTSTDDLGYKHVRLRQVYAGLPVWGAELIVHFDREDRIYLVNGHYLPTPDGLSTHPGLSETQALRLAGESVGQAHCDDCRAELMVFGVRDAKAILAYSVLVKLDLMNQWRVFVEAQSGQILDRFSTVPTDTPDFERGDHTQ